MFLLGGLTALLFGASLTAYGVLFLPVCVLTAVWVRRGGPDDRARRRADRVRRGAAAGGRRQAVTRRLMVLFTALATQAGWLYGGTLIAGLIVIVRRIRLVHRRRTAGARPPV